MLLNYTSFIDIEIILYLSNCKIIIQKNIILHTAFEIPLLPLQNEFPSNKTRYIKKYYFQSNHKLSEFNSDNTTILSKMKTVAFLVFTIAFAHAYYLDHEVERQRREISWGKQVGNGEVFGSVGAPETGGAQVFIQMHP